MNVQTESYTRLHGRWLFIARVAWITTFIALTLMYAFGFFAVHSALSTVCENDLCTLNRQIRHTDGGDKLVSWSGPPIGAANRLRPEQLEALKTFGLTLDQYGWLGALQMGIPIMVYLLIAAGLFWWKSDDWMALFASMMIATFPLQSMPLPFTLVVQAPVWEWVFTPTSIVALGFFIIFPLIFPTGRCVPRWTRWVVVYDFIGSVVIIAFQNRIMENISITRLVPVFLLIAFGAGVYAQLYRYFRVASPVERQQIKWTIVGLAGFVGIAFTMLGLNELLISKAPTMDPARAILLSTIPDTVFHLILLFIPISIAISVLRYRLWDIDVIISRTLVYGALTASIVVLYVLIVGGLGTLLQTQNNLPSILIAIALIAFLFQPLRRRLQGIVDRFIPVQWSMPPLVQQEHQMTVQKEQGLGHTKVRGGWLFVARLVWAVVFITLTAMYTFGFLAVRDALSTVCKGEPCTLMQQIRHTEAGEKVESWLGPSFASADRLRPDQVEALATLGLTLEQYGWLAALQLGLPLLVYLLIAAGLYWWKSDDWMVFFASVMVATIPIGPVPLAFTLAVRQPAWEWVFDATGMVAISCLFIFPLIFPTGRFVPRWTRWTVLFHIAFSVIVILFRNLISENPSDDNLVFVYLLVAFAIGIYAQMYRYFRVAAPVERQQLKWVIVGLAGFISIGAAVLQPLDALLTSQAGSMYPAREILLSVILDTLFQVILLFIPVSMAISVLRYRLWDIDIIISRTLVYGILSAGIVVSYILLVGLLGTLFNTNVSLAAALVTAALTVPFFQPSRARLQSAVDRVVFSGRDTPSSKLEIDESQSIEKPLRQHWLAWLLFDLTCIASAISLVFLALSRMTSVPDMWGFRGDGILFALAFSSIGVLLARRLPQNTIGWLLLVAGLLCAILEFCIEYATYALLTESGTLRGGTLAAWMASWIWVIAIDMLLYSFLLFPTGHLPSARWRPVAVFVIAAFGLTSFAFMIQPGALYFAPYLSNPFGVQAADRMLSPLQLVTAVAILLIGISLILRLRSAKGIERQQLKWFAYAATLITLIGITDSLASATGPTGGDPKFYQYLTIGIWIAIPCAIAFSILRYRLWDIDVIINRTLVYGTLSAGIVVTYIVLVGLLGTLFNTNVNLVATLVTTALTIPFFQSFRARLQDTVNRVTNGGRDAPDLKQEIAEMPPASEVSLRPRWLEAVHAAWFVCAVLAAIVLIGTVPVYVSRYIHPSLSDPYSLGRFNVPFQALLGWGAFAESLISFGLAILLFWRKPNDRMALFGSFFFMITTVSNTYDYFLTTYVGAQSSPLNFFNFVTVPLWILLFCIFPDGRFVPRWTRWLFFVSIFAAFSYFLFPAWWSILQFTAAPQFILITYAQIYRYRRVSSDIERQQTKWVLFGLLLTMLLSLIASLLYKKPSGPLINIIPLTVAIAILRSRLWDIDLIINRTLVYGALSAGIIALYILLVGALSLLSQTTGSLLISLLATGLIAFLFQPLRERLQSSVNRLLYGDRDDPYAALSRLGRRLEASLTPEAVLPTIVTTVREALKLPYTAIYLKQPDDDYKIIAESASPSLRVENGKIRVPGMNREGQCIPLIHQGETLGYLVLGPRTPNEAFSSSDLRLVDDLAPQVGVAVHAMRLTSDLQRSREQLVLTREEERRRLRRDLHDGLGPNLASQGLKLAAVRQLLENNPTAAIPLLDQVMEQNNSTVADVRRLVYGLRPPALDELGLVAAIRDYVSGMDGKSTLQIEIKEPPQGLPPLSAGVEVAAYRIVLEALTNVVRYAQATSCLIHFSVTAQGPSDMLRIEIEDNGCGIPVVFRAGVGLRSMQERAEELNGSCLVERRAEGGTRVLARLPIGVSKASAPSLDH